MSTAPTLDSGVEWQEGGCRVEWASVKRIRFRANALLKQLRFLPLFHDAWHHLSCGSCGWCEFCGSRFWGMEDQSWTGEIKPTHLKYIFGSLQVPYSRKFSNGANFRIIISNARSIFENKNWKFEQHGQLLGVQFEALTINTYLCTATLPKLQSSRVTFLIPMDRYQYQLALPR